MDAAKMQAVKVSTVSCCVASEAEVTDAEGSAQASLGSPRVQTCLQSQVGGISDRNHEEHQGDAKHVDSAAAGCDPVNTWGNRVLPGWGCAAARLEMCCSVATLRIIPCFACAAVIRGGLYWATSVAPKGLEIEVEEKDAQAKQKHTCK